MKSATAALLAHLNQRDTNLALCIKAKRIDGTLYGWTEHDKALSINLSDGDGAITYSPSEGFIKSALKTSAGLNVDETESEGFFASAGITKADMRAGRWDFANVWIFLANWKAPTAGVIKLRRGKLGRLKGRDETYIAEIRSLFELYNQELCRIYNTACGVDLGSSIDQQGGGCGVRLEAPQWAAFTVYTVRDDRDASSGSVVRPTTFNDRYFKATTVTEGSPTAVSGATEPAWNLTIGGTTQDGDITWTTIQATTIESQINSVTDQRTFVLAYSGSLTTGGSPTVSYLDGGVCTFVDGLNAGLKFEVRQFDPTTKTVTLYLPAPFTINAGSPGDTVKIAFGCDKMRATCRDVFDNILNFQGYPDIPGNDKVFATPDVSY
jgi:uncharacterized phage protein (TIGR02218 family)